MLFSRVAYIALEIDWQKVGLMSWKTACNGSSLAVVSFM